MAHGRTFEQRFPNRYTRPDLSDPLTKKVQADSKEIFGHDPLEEKIHFPSYLADLQRKHSTPEFQAAVAEGAKEEEIRLAGLRHDEYMRNIEKLSPFHVEAIRGNKKKGIKPSCDAELNPLTTTELQRRVIAQWDGESNLFLLGNTGIGKTYTATWCAMKAALEGHSVASTTATRVCEASPEALNLLRSVNALVLDQLHTLRSPAGKDMPAWQVAPVIDLIDYRHQQKRIIIAAGTIAPQFMVGLLGEDVVRRFPLRLASDSVDVRRERK